MAGFEQGSAGFEHDSAGFEQGSANYIWVRTGYCRVHIPSYSLGVFLISALINHIFFLVFCESEPPTSSVLPSLNHIPPHKKSVLPPINAKLSLKDENGVSELSTSTIEIKGIGIFKY